MIKLIYIDLFCGGGGTTTGVHKARIDDKECAIVAACINHDANAIRSHKSNHKQTLHFTEDITLLYNTNRMQRLVKHVEWLKSQYPDAEVVLWASLECTNFSKAKGGLSRDADSRTLADHLFPYIEQLKPDRIQIENVEEFMLWGPLIVKVITTPEGYEYCPCNIVKEKVGNRIIKSLSPQMVPDPNRLREYYNIWIDKVKTYGYHYQYRILNAADYGAYTSRKRFFGQFARMDDMIYWPEQTHAEKPESNLFDTPMKKWNAVRDILDLTDEGKSIFDRDKPLVDATMDRIYAGLIKFVAGGKREFLLKYNSMSQRKKYVAPGVDQPCPTVSTQGRLNFCSVQFLSAYYSNGDNVSDIDKPSPTVTTKDRLTLVQTQFMDQQFGKSKPSNLNRPVGCVTVNPKYAPVTVKRFILNQYTGGGQHSSISRPCPAIATVPKQNLVTPHWLMNTNFNNVGSSVEKPAQVVTANRKWHYLLNPQFESAGGSIDKPSFTLIARMDKMPPYLVDATTNSSNLPSFVQPVADGFLYNIYDTDPEPVVKIKEFMCMYGITDIFMRMLRIPELKKIMGFPEDYVLIGTQADQKKFIGNAVEVHMATAIVEATAKGITEKQMAA